MSETALNMNSVFPIEIGRSLRGIFEKKEPNRPGFETKVIELTNKVMHDDERSTGITLERSFAALTDGKISAKERATVANLIAEKVNLIKSSKSLREQCSLALDAIIGLREAGYSLPKIKPADKTSTLTDLIYLADSVADRVHKRRQAQAATRSKPASYNMLPPNDGAQPPPRRNKSLKERLREAQNNFTNFVSVNAERIWLRTTKGSTATRSVGAVGGIGCALVACLVVGATVLYLNQAVGRPVIEKGVGIVTEKTGYETPVVISQADQGVIAGNKYFYNELLNQEDIENKTDMTGKIIAYIRRMDKPTRMLSLNALKEVLVEKDLKTSDEAVAYIVRNFSGVQDSTILVLLVQVAYDPSLIDKLDEEIGVAPTSTPTGIPSSTPTSSSSETPSP